MNPTALIDLSELLRQQFKAQAEGIALQANTEAATKFLGAARDWALNKQHGANVPPPVAPFAVVARVSFENIFDFKLDTTTMLVSDVKPESFLPVALTDIGAVGGIVGGPIPERPGCFYIVSTYNAYLGEKTTVTDASGKVRKFFCTGRAFFERYWEEV